MEETKAAIQDILHVSIGTIAKYESKDLYQLIVKVIKDLEQTKRAKQWIESAIALKYEEQIRAKRLRQEKDTGVIHLEDGAFKLTNEAAKKVEWDQAKLAKIAATITVNGGVLSDYIETYYTVPETKYNGWSETVKNLFTSARTVSFGKVSYKLSKSDNEVSS